MRRLATDESVGYTAAGRRIGLGPTENQRRSQPVMCHQHVAGFFLFDGPLDLEMRIDLISVQKSYRPQIRPVKSEFSNTFVAAY